MPRSILFILCGNRDVAHAADVAVDGSRWARLFDTIPTLNDSSRSKRVYRARFDFLLQGSPTGPRDIALTALKGFVHAFRC